ncbi:manganese-dependent inorganic pyrophosphatase [Candidatus Methanoperedenaceae archaeon GB50]|nr:manganese-dependent inorganic pyrophosphatase [Candidatus Methanoperedenaceae archaeon GB37]CAD7768506.1 manganese-dependent inorganic pyrophosphatase [Candidatus Methanoperedenaceae archaeon GB50]CAD7773890.1 MAG: manganese-dependent inorganic pyrophosphatase [Candidatus Methanoperedenaceae archaeon GB50]
MGKDVSYDEFYSLLTEFRDPIFLCHRNADPDAIGSAYALREVFGGTIGVVDSVDRISTTLLNYLEVKPIHRPDLSRHDITVVLDTSTHAQIDGIELGRYCLIDHHTTNNLLENSEFYIHKPTSSTAEIIYTMLHDAGHSFSLEMGIALVAGIITDTGHFKHATPDAMRITADLLEEARVQYGEVLDLLSSTPHDVSMRIAMMKTAMRAQIVRVGDWIIATSHVSSFNGAAAATLVNIGADVAFVASAVGENVRISSRARRAAIEKGVALGRMLDEMGKRHNGTGGGHDGAAGLEAKGKQDEILSECVERVRQILEE